MSDLDHDPLQPHLPTPIAKQFVKYVLGFMVAVGIGLAPYLGKLEVPLFSALLNLLPMSMHNTVLPLSAFLMGIVAVCTQWYAAERLARSRLNRLFVSVLAVLLAGTVALLVIHNRVVVEVDIPATGETATYLVGFSRSNRPPCTQEISNAECLVLLTLDEARIASFWGDQRINDARLALTSAYILCTACFGALVGVLVLGGQHRGSALRRPGTGTKAKRQQEPMTADPGA